MVENPPANAGDLIDVGLILELGRSPRVENATHSSILENPMDGGAWRSTVYTITQSWTQLKRRSMHARDVACMQDSNRAHRLQQIKLFCVF